MPVAQQTTTTTHPPTGSRRGSGTWPYSQTLSEVAGSLALVSSGQVYYLAEV